MNQYSNPCFPADFLSGYIEDNPDGLYRFRTYSLFRFFSAAGKTNTSLAASLREYFSISVSKESLQIILHYLSEDFYFSPCIQGNSFDPVFLYYAILAAKNADENTSVNSLITDLCPCLEHMNVTDSPDIRQEITFYGALALLSFRHPDQLSRNLPKFAAVYRDKLHFTCEDFILFNFMDEYFEIKNCRSNPKFRELISTLTLATLHAFDTTVEQCITDAHSQLTHPHSKFAGLHRFGALTLSDSDTAGNDEDAAMMKQLFEYAVTYELRSNLFDFHLDEDRIITLDNWKEKLKWYNVQYNNVYELALSSFYASSLSRRLLVLQFEDNLRSLEKM